MKCENCNTELVGASIVCRQCNHNNAKSRVGQWRARQSHERSSVAQASATRSISPLPSPSAAPKPEIKRLPIEPASPNSPRLASVPFESKSRINQIGQIGQIEQIGQIGQAAIPKSSPAKTSTAAEDDPNLVQFPAWRSQLKDKVKEVRERRTTPNSGDDLPDEAQLDPNPIVESALKRIRWSQHIPPSQTQPTQTPDEQAETKPPVQEQPIRELKTATREQKLEAPQITEVRRDTNPFQRVEPKPDSQPLPRATHSSTNPLLARKPVIQPAIRPEPVSPPSPKPESVQQFPVETETRIELKRGSGSLPVAPKPRSGSLPPVPVARTTSEIKQPDSSPQKTHSGSLAQTPQKTHSGSLAQTPQRTPSGSLVQPIQRTPSGSLVQPPKNHVETTVIGLAPSVSNLASGRATSSLKPGAATLWGRTLAGTCDFEIVAMAYLPVFGSYAILNTSVGYESVIILLALLAMLIFCYQLLTLTIANRTTGMALLRLRLVNSSNREKPVTFTQKFLRAFAATVASFLPPINFLVIQSNPQHRSLPDLISGTSLLERVKSS